MLNKVETASLSGVEGYPVTVETDLPVRSIRVCSEQPIRELRRRGWEKRVVIDSELCYFAEYEV